MKSRPKDSIVLGGMTIAFVGLAVAFLSNLWGHTAPLPPIPLVDPQFTNTATVRMSAAELINSDEDSSGLDCYLCHEEGKVLPLKFDDKGAVILPEEHSDLVMGHGRHNRNNNCYNCHNEENLRLLQTRDGRKLEITNSTPLCGSCHGPTLRDWEAGAHGRTGGVWTREEGVFTRRNCTSCHNPHAPHFPSLKPAPGPHPLRSPADPDPETPNEH